jgi:hypothetical protein
VDYSTCRVHIFTNHYSISEVVEMVMNILFIVPYVPSLIRTRSYNMIHFLSELGNRVTLVTLWTDDQEKKDMEELRQVCEHVYGFPMPVWRSLWNCASVLPTNKPLQAAYS